MIEDPIPPLASGDSGVVQAAVAAMRPMVLLAQRTTAEAAERRRVAEADLAANDAAYEELKQQVGLAAAIATADAANVAANIAAREAREAHETARALEDTLSYALREARRWLRSGPDQENKIRRGGAARSTR